MDETDTRVDTVHAFLAFSPWLHRIQNRDGEDDTSMMGHGVFHKHFGALMSAQPFHFEAEIRNPCLGIHVQPDRYRTPANATSSLDEWLDAPG